MWSMSRDIKVVETLKGRQRYQRPTDFWNLSSGAYTFVMVTLMFLDADFYTSYAFSKRGRQLRDEQFVYLEELRDR